jgi:Fe-S cluster assembly protein SufD
MTARVPQRSAAEATLNRQFEAETALSSSMRRAHAFRRFAERGLPTRRVESWHYTDLRAALREAAPLAPAPDRSTIETGRQILAARRRSAAWRLVLLNGRVVAELCEPLPPGASIARDEPPTADVDDPMVALNEAMSVDVHTLTVADGATIEGPIEIVHLTIAKDARSLYSRFAISLGVGASASFVETFVGAGHGAQRNSSTILMLAVGAKAKHIVVVEDNADLHIESQISQLASRAEFHSFAIVAGAALTRRQLFHKLVGEEAKITLGGLTLLDGTRHADTTLQVVHAAKAGTSREYYRAIVDDQAVGVFQGKVIVESAAHKTDGAMKSQAVLLSPQAQMNAKPELEIFADDVVCGHGATVGSLDPEQLFYMMARGIERGEAESMLLQAFGEEAIGRIDDNALAEALRQPFRTWLVRENTARVHDEGKAISTESVS